MKVLLLVEDVQIMKALTGRLDSRGREYHVMGGTEFSNIADLSQFLTQHNIALVVNTASLTLLQQCPDTKLIVELTSLVQACVASGVSFMQLSNSQVFDGIDGGRHREIDHVSPASRVGAISWQMEEAIRGVCSRHIILRVPTLFSAEGDNILTHLLAGFKEGGDIEFSETGKCSPVHCDDFSRVVVGIIDQLACGAKVWGTYHYSSSDPVSAFQFAEVLLKAASPYIDASATRLVSIDRSDTYWPKPLLNCEKILNTFGIKQLPWRSFLAPSVEALLSGSDGGGQATNGECVDGVK